MTEQPPVHIRNIDFSEFHPLDHNLLQCQDYPGGRRRHVEYRWYFQVKDRLFRPLCMMGLHVLDTWSRRVGPDREKVYSWQQCGRCGYRPAPEPSELPS